MKNKAIISVLIIAVAITTITATSACKFPRSTVISGCVYFALKELLHARLLSMQLPSNY